MEDEPDEDSEFVFAPTALDIAIFIPEFSLLLLVHNMGVEFLNVIYAHLVYVIVLDIVFVLEIFEFRNTVLVYDHCKDSW